jgi:hypothetical protein
MKFYEAIIVAAILCIILASAIGIIYFISNGNYLLAFACFFIFLVFFVYTVSN